ncbi:MAG: glycosyltransferase [Parcubacteria group bacterium]|nr:glycosyltransferase [Parcubacteria group bacterium]
MARTDTTLKTFPVIRVPHWLILLSAGITLVYSTWWLDMRHAGAWVLYGALLIGEIYHIWQALGYMYTIWGLQAVREKGVSPNAPNVDVFITVCGEPRHIVEETLAAALVMEYPRFTVTLLNDGYVAHKPNWREIEELAHAYGARVITRTVPGGAKAGNINNALAHTSAPFFAVFDADHVPHRDFLAKTVGYFEDPKMALVQTPQYYKNKDENLLTRAAWEQQELFFGPICQGKNRANATFWCGTNAVLRRAALDQVGGIPTKTVTEDFLVTLFLHQKGWRSLYISEVLAEGLAPHTLGDYVSQQFRWARGCLELIFKYNPLFKRGLTWAQRMHYLYSAGYYLNGIVVLIDAIIPLIVLFTAISPVDINTNNFIVYFFPFIFSTIYLLMRSTGYTVTFRAIQMSMSSFFVFFMAAVSALFNRKTSFVVTSKTASERGNFLIYALPHLVYTGVAAIAIVYAILTQGRDPSIITNASWALFNIVFFWGFVRVAYPWARVPTRIAASLSLAWARTFRLAKRTALISVMLVVNLILFVIRRKHE